MATNMKAAQELLFGTEGLGASNFKMFPGHSREVTPEMIAGEITRAIQDISAGKGEELVIE